MILKQMTADSPDLPRCEALNNEAFPENERVPIRYFFSPKAQENRRVLGIYEEERFVGFFVILLHSRTAYICYFAICAEERSKGYGGQALAVLDAYYPDRQITVDFEALDASADNAAQRIRRRNFYRRNGYHETGWFLYYMQTEFEVMANTPAFDRDDFTELLAALSRSVPQFQPRMYRKEG